MAQQTINVGTAPNDGTGDTLKTSFTKCNANFTELYTAAATYQPLDADLTAIAALAGTNTIYYRSASNVWSPVVVSTGLAFSGGNLTSTVTGGAPVGAEYITSIADATLSAERVLTDTTTITWDRATAGQIKANIISGSVLLNTVTATAAASVDFTSLLTSAYDEYEVHFSNVYASVDANHFFCRVGQSGVYQAASYSYALNAVGSGGTNAPTGALGTGAGVPLAYPGIVSSTAGFAISGKMSISAPLGTVAYKQVLFNSAYISSASTYNVVNGGGYFSGNTNAVDSLRFCTNTGNISGTFKLYGIK